MAFAALVGSADPEFAPAREIIIDLLDEGPTRIGEPGVVVLHGDVHAGNVLRFGGRGTQGTWKVIDPKGIVGFHAFDYLNLFTNPAASAGGVGREAVDHFDRRLAIVSEAAELDPAMLLRWIVAWSALSALWHVEDHDQASAELPRAIMRIALARR